MANRWVALPPSTLPPEQDTNSGLHYDDLDDAAPRKLAFTVVPIGRRRHRHVIMETFTSATSKWETSKLPAQGPQGFARCVGPTSPGIHIDECFYWLTRLRGHILHYDVAGGHFSMVRELAEVERSIGRAARSLRSTSSGRSLVELSNLNEPKDDNLCELYHRNHVLSIFRELYRRYHVFPFFG
ncbi:hypothetical protein E2562_012909 [Oryza meyeriana var. granulata]|uniref:Uncharacterized protein n=1 Tax=Oryza meyeriana var. granulata TaxID=110450 RepID=A0A6G1CFW7_9ORYZ|nr:hypothetical protein E2562_012909 [Oryza meyeriana var. granulata]